MSMSIMLNLIYLIYWTSCSSSYLMMWMCMEMNTMMFIPLMMNKSFMNNSINAMIKYFIIQSFSSSLMMIMIIALSMMFNFNLNNNFNVNTMKMIIICTLLMKMGASPFHWWFPMIMIKLSWFNCFMLMTIQKIMPMFMMIYMNIMNNMMLNMLIMMSIITGALMGLNQTSIKLILSYSSINHLGWMLMNLNMSIDLFSFYFMIYSLTNLLICLIMKSMNSNYLTQLFKNLNFNMNLKIMLLMAFMSLGGLPPFIGFFPKLLTIMMMIKNNMFFESMIMIMSALITLKFYLNLMMPSFSLMSMSNKWNMNQKMMTNKFKLIYSMSFFFSFFFLIMMIFLINE